MCCKAPSIPALNKPEGEWCKRCKIGHGCTQYEARPEACAGYKCLWLRSQEDQTVNSWPLEMRPDKSKVMLSPTPDENLIMASVDPGRPDAWKQAPMSIALERFAAAGANVLISVGVTNNKIVMSRDAMGRITHRNVAMSNPDSDGIQRPLAHG